MPGVDPCGRAEEKALESLGQASAVVGLGFGRQRKLGCRPGKDRLLELRQPGLQPRLAALPVPALLLFQQVAVEFLAELAQQAHRDGQLPGIA